MIGVFNRSHYEEVLVRRVEPKVLERERLPVCLTKGKHFWEEQLEDYCGLRAAPGAPSYAHSEVLLKHQPEEQRKRFLARPSSAPINALLPFGGDALGPYRASVPATAAL